MIRRDVRSWHRARALAFTRPTPAELKPGDWWRALILVALLFAALLT